MVSSIQEPETKEGITELSIIWSSWTHCMAEDTAENIIHESPPEHERPRLQGFQSCWEGKETEAQWAD